MPDHDAVAPNLPPELLRATPRPVRLSAGGVAVSALAAALLAAAAAGVFWLLPLSARQAQRRAEFDRQAVTGEAEILAIGPRRGKQSDRRVAYRFTVAGRVYSGRATLRRGELRGLEPGSHRPVRYLPADPSVNYLGRGPGVLPPWAVPLIVVPLGVAAAALFWSVRKERRLLSEGRAAVARVTASRRAHHGRRRIEYRYRTLSGALVSASSEIRGRAVPDYVTILYDRERPRRAAPYPLALVRIGR